VPFGSMNSLGPRPRDLRVRSAGFGSKEKLRKGPAPGWRGGGPPCPLRWVGIGRETCRRAAKKPGSETPNVHPTENTLRKGPTTGWRGGRTSVSAPLGWDRQRIVPLGSQKTRIGNPCVPHQEHHPAKLCPEGTFLDSPGFVRSITLGCEAIIHFSPERAGLTEAAGMNRGLKSTSIVRVRSPTIGPVPATAASSEPLQGSGV
jgi:hypothetical protein